MPRKFIILDGRYVQVSVLNTAGYRKFCVRPVAGGHDRIVSVSDVIYDYDRSHQDGECVDCHEYYKDCTCNAYTPLTIW